MSSRIDTDVRTLQRVPELASLAILDTTLDIVSDALLAADLEVIHLCDPDEAPAYHLRHDPPHLHIARAILELVDTLRACLVAYDKAVSAPKALPQPLPEDDIPY